MKFLALLYGYIIWIAFFDHSVVGVMVLLRAVNLILLGMVNLAVKIILVISVKMNYSKGPSPLSIPKIFFFKNS